jgi:hypothetical protein
MNEAEMLEAERRAAEFREMAEECCSQGGLFFGDQFELDAEKRLLNG